jgi:hypothetical protein
MNNLEIINNCYSQLKEPTLGSISDASKGEWPTSVMQSRVNVINQEICSITKCLKKNDSITSVASQWEYDVASDCQEVLEVYRYDGSKYYELTYLPMNVIAEKDRDWRTTFSTGNMANWFIPPNSGKIGVYYGFDSVVTDGLNYYYVAIPADMSEATDLPFGGDTSYDAFHKAIVDGVTAWCRKEDGNKKYSLFEADYQNALGRLTALCDTPDGKRLSFSLRTRKGQNRVGTVSTS